MALQPQERGTYTLKTYDSQIVTWSPDVSLQSPNIGSGNINIGLCTALPFSQGQDWITTYCYDFSILDGVQLRLAYVECDYVL